jgi:tellurite resistance protein TerC|uniref:TerC family protein n=1 Tax=Candidatus Planktophila sp. TaxID=2175601 RepID=UPI004049E94E
MDVTLLTWALVVGAIIALIVVDLLTVSSKPHDVLFKEAAIWSIFYIGIAISFGVWVWLTAGSQFGTEYFAAYLVEKSLSVDNLFVFIIILAQFKVPSIYHQQVLMFGVILALILRAIFIAVGAAALAAFSFTFVIFGAILIWTGVGLFKHWDEDPSPEDNFLVRSIRKRIAMTDEYDGSKIFTRINGKRIATPMFLVIIAIGSTDLLFALDSIPATFGVTQEPFLVFAANAFALLGLRALYFLLKGLLDKLVYLSLGLSVILMFIGVKLIMTYLHETWAEIPKIPTLVSLAVIATILIVSTIASLIKVKKDPTAHAHAGRVTEAKKPHSHEEEK